MVELRLHRESKPIGIAIPSPTSITLTSPLDTNFVNFFMQNRLLGQRRKRHFYHFATAHDHPQLHYDG